MRILILTILICVLKLIKTNDSYGELQLIKMGELDHLINTKNLFVLVAVSDLCDELCQQKINLLNELKTILKDNNSDNLENIEFYSSKDVDILQKYGISKYPCAIYFRMGHFIVYKGEFLKEAFINWLQEKKKKNTIELNDSNFEHDTQAATGSTTGDWFIIFHNNNCATSNLIQSYWEEASLRLKGQINLAYVNLDKNPIIQKRFHLYNSPNIIFFRNGLMYRYEIERFDTESLISFTTGWFKNVKAEKVPKELTAFDNLLDMFTDLLRENNKTGWYFLYGIVCFIVVATCILMCRLFKKSANSGLLDRTNSRFKFD